jgi:NAD(P)-dependent dehydrogenase (short-subunit alcohol dehydrogenase family)
MPARPRRYGRPVKIARAAAFLASDDAREITGRVIRVDGGKHCFAG